MLFSSSGCGTDSTRDLGLEKEADTTSCYGLCILESFDHLLNDVQRASGDDNDSTATSTEITSILPLQSRRQTIPVAASYSILPNVFGAKKSYFLVDYSNRR